MGITTNGRQGALIASAMVVAGVAALLYGCMDDDPSDANGSAAAPAAERLHVPEADSGTARSDGETVVVSLKVDDGRVVWFEDRPARGHGDISLQELVSEWTELGSRTTRRTP